MGGVGDNTIAHWCAELADHDQQISELQDAKRDLFKAIREEHGKVLADAVKGALRLSRMTPEQLDRRVETDAETDRILRIIERGTPIATHVARGANDPETEPASAADRDAGGGEDAPVSCVDTKSRPLGIRLSTSLAGVEGDVDRQPISEPGHGHVGEMPTMATRQGGEESGMLDSLSARAVVPGGVHIPHHGVVRA